MCRRLGEDISLELFYYIAISLLVGTALNVRGKDLKTRECGVFISIP